MSWNNNNWQWNQQFYESNRPNKRRMDELSEMIDNLRQELALSDYHLTNELQSDVFCEYDRTILAAELYKERLMALTTSSRSQMLVVQMGAALVRYAQANQLQYHSGSNAKRAKYNHNAVVPSNSYQYTQQNTWNGNCYNNRTTTGKKNRKRKRNAPMANTIPVQVSTGSANTGITSIKTSNSPVGKACTALVKTTNSPPAKACTTIVKISNSPPAKICATSVKTNYAQVTATATSKGTATPAKLASTLTKTTTSNNTPATMTSVTKASTQATTGPTTKTNAQVKPTSTVTAKSAPIRNIPVPINKTIASRKKSTASGKKTTGKFKTTSAPGKKSMLPVKATTAPFRKNCAPLLPTPAPFRNNCGPLLPTPALVQTNSAQHTTFKPSQTATAPMVSVKTELPDTNVTSLNIPSLFSLNMAQIQSKFSKSDRFTIKSENTLCEPIIDLCTPIKKERTDDDSHMCDDLEDHI